MRAYRATTHGVMSRSRTGRSLRVGLYLLIASLVSVSASATTVRYCIDGESTGRGWSIDVMSWNPPSGGAVSFAAECPGVPAGSGSPALAQAFVDCVNANGMDIVTAAVDPENPSYFTISSEHVQIDLRVGPAGGNADCEVTGAGCAFNPVIVRITPPNPHL